MNEINNCTESANKINSAKNERYEIEQSMLLVNKRLEKEKLSVIRLQKILGLNMFSQIGLDKYINRSLKRKYKRIDDFNKAATLLKFQKTSGLIYESEEELATYLDISKSDNKNSVFCSKLYKLAQTAVSYTYPEGKNDYTPDFTRPVILETSMIKNIKEFNMIVQKIGVKLNLQGLEWTYNNLDDEYSKEMMLRVVVYNLFDDVKIRFPLYYSNTFFKLNDYEQAMRIDDEQINLWFDIIKLKKYDLAILGYDLKMWFTMGGIFIDLVNEQYRYKNIVKAEKGDVVVDGGACYGDTALYFAHNTQSKVFSFEFLDENINIFNKNMDLNPKYKDYVTLVPKPLSKVSGEKLYAISNGPGTSVTKQYKDGAKEFETISIDDFVAQNRIEKIDFIKLDVECSEEAVLRGAIKTIRKFKPKLAICVYHKEDDLWTIPQLIKEILPEYKLYLDHHTINFTETLIYAKV